MTFTDEHLSAYLDGELDLATENALTGALASDPALRVRLEELRLANDLVKKAYAPIGDDPLPGGVLDTIDDHFAAGPEVITFPKPARKQNWITRWQTPLAAALAMAAGLTFGSSVLQTAEVDQTPISLMAGEVPAGSPLHTALSTAPSAQTVDIGAATVRPVLTFAAQDGDICREILVQTAEQGSRALSCRSNGAWTILATVVEPNAGGAGALFSTAASPASQIFDRTVESLIDGAPFSAEEEARALASAPR